MNKTTPRDFFTHIGIIITLYVSSVSLIALLFQIINVAFPEALSSYYSPVYDPYSTGIRWAIASLVIIFPLFLLLSWFLGKQQAGNPELRALGVRRWLTFLTLFVTGIAVATDLIILINSFLGGEITVRFVLKVLVVLIVAGSVFGYYLWDLRRAAGASSRPKIFAIVAGVVVIASVVGGFVVMGSPATQRLMRFDATKASDLQTIQWQIVNYWQQKQILPVGLADINDPISGFTVPVDPQSGESYDYRKITNLKFELCADFNLESRNGISSGVTKPVPAGFDREQQNWAHGIGRTCFERTIDPQLYPPIPRAKI